MRSSGTGGCDGRLRTAAAEARDAAEREEKRRAQLAAQRATEEAALAKLKAQVAVTAVAAAPVAAAPVAAPAAPVAPVAVVKDIEFKGDDTTGRLDHLLTGTEMEVIGIGEHHTSASAGDAPDVNALHRRRGRHRHEERRGDRAVGRDERPGAGAVGGRLQCPLHRRDCFPFPGSIVVVHASAVPFRPHQPGSAGALPMQW
jgi:hypothetical protein